MSSPVLAEWLRQVGETDIGARIHQKRFMQACAEQRSLDVAFRFARLVSPPDLRVFNMLLSTCTAVGDTDAAFRAFRELQSSGLQADTVAFTALISCCAQAGEVGRAFEAYAEMRGKGVKPNVVTFGALMDCLSRDIARAADAGNRKLVVARLAHCGTLQMEMGEAHVLPDSVVFNSLVCACGRAAAVHKPAIRLAFAALHEMSALGLQACAYTYSALMDGCTRAGDPLRALAVWSEYVAVDHQLVLSPQLVGAAAHACAAAGDLARAMSIYRDSLIRGMRPDGVLFAILMVCPFAFRY